MKDRQNSIYSEIYEPLWQKSYIQAGIGGCFLMVQVQQSVRYVCVCTFLDYHFWIS